MTICIVENKECDNSSLFTRTLTTYIFLVYSWRFKSLFCLEEFSIHFTSYLDSFLQCGSVCFYASHCLTANLYTNFKPSICKHSLSRFFPFKSNQLEHQTPTFECQSKALLSFPFPVTPLLGQVFQKKKKKGNLEFINRVRFQDPWFLNAFSIKPGI